MTWLLDFAGFSLSTNIPIRTARDIIYVLQNHYPERLAVVILYNPPRIFEAFFKVCPPALKVILVLLHFWMVESYGFGHASFNFANLSCFLSVLCPVSSFNVRAIANPLVCTTKSYHFSQSGEILVGF